MNKQEKYELASELMKNMKYLKYQQNIKSERIKEIFNECNTYQKIKLYALDLIKDDTNFLAMRLRIDILLTLPYKKLEAIETIKEYISLYEEHIKDLNYLYNRLTELEVKAKRYEDALEHVNILLCYNSINASYISTKIEILKKLERKEELINFINKLKETEEYKTAHDNLSDFADLETKERIKEFNKWRIKMCVKQCEKNILE